MKILIDNCHGIETKGKRSPDGRLLEYAQNRLLAGRIVSALQARSLDGSLLVPEETGISLPERCRQLGKDNVLLISIHCNAAGRGDLWLSARGWCAYTTRGNTRADALATSLYTAAGWAGVVGAAGADAAAPEEDFATLGCFHRFRAGIAVLDAEDFAAAVRAFDRFAMDRNRVVFDGYEFLEVVVVYLQEAA